MAKPILRTPDLTGADAERFLAMHRNMTLSKQKEQILKSCVNTYRKHKK